jgi:hypothetical protein
MPFSMFLLALLLEIADENPPRIRHKLSDGTFRPLILHERTCKNQLLYNFDRAGSSDI